MRQPFGSAILPVDTHSCGLGQTCISEYATYNIIFIIESGAQMHMSPPRGKEHRITANTFWSKYLAMMWFTATWTYIATTSSQECARDCLIVSHVYYRIVGNFRMVQIFVFFECTFRMRKFEHAKIYITRGLHTRASDHTKF